MTTSPQIDSISVEHPVLGTAVSIYADRRQALVSTFVYLAFVLLGILGLFLGQSDIASGSAVLGLAELAGGVVLGLYSIRAAFIAARRLGRPIALVVGREGFEYARGNGPVQWAEVATVGDPASPAAQPRMLRVQLVDPQDYVRRHALSPVEGIELRVHHNDLYLGNGTRLSVAAVQALMNERLVEFRRVAHGESEEPARARRRPQAPKRPRPLPKP